MHQANLFMAGDYGSLGLTPEQGVTQSSGQHFFTSHLRRMSVFQQPARPCILYLICLGCNTGLAIW